MSKAKQKVAGQLSLFSGERGARAEGARYLPGEIVRQTWPWIGHYHVAFVYFQVRHWEVHRDRVEYLCMPVPYGSHYNDVNWFPEEDLVSLGRSFEVPPYEKLKESGIVMRYYNQHMGYPWEEGWPAEYMSSLHREILIPVAGASPFAKEGGCPWPDMAPFAWEREMVEFLDTQPVKWYECTRDNWYEKFPRCEDERDSNRSGKAAYPHKASAPRARHKRASKRSTPVAQG